MLHLAPILLLICVVCIFTGLLIKIRYPLFERLVGVFAPYVWVGMVILKWFWREPKRYKQARGA